MVRHCWGVKVGGRYYDGEKLGSLHEVEICWPKAKAAAQLRKARRKYKQKAKVVDLFEELAKETHGRPTSTFEKVFAGAALAFFVWNLARSR
jgi:hypothetical protein